MNDYLYAKYQDCSIFLSRLMARGPTRPPPAVEIFKKPSPGRVKTRDIASRDFDGARDEIFQKTINETTQNVSG